MQVVYEHLHRYLWAAELVEGRRVLDLASGEGFGAAVLARSARSVVGVDIDKRTVEHSRLNYKMRGLSFAVADARELSTFDDGSFDAVVAFEMIEHVEDQERVLDEIQRVLAPDGFLIMSTPDREAYGEASQENPYHVHELDRDELGELVRPRFKHLTTFGQRTITGSAVAALDDVGHVGTEKPARSFFVERVGDEWQVEPALSPLYIIAVASNGQLPAAARDSTLADPRLALVEASIAEHLDQRTLEVARLRARSIQDQSTIAALDAALNAANQKNRRIEQSVTWQLFQRVRARTFALLGGEESQAVEFLQRTLRFLGRTLLRGQALLSGGPASVRVGARRSRGGPIRFPRGRPARGLNRHPAVHARRPHGGRPVVDSRKHERDPLRGDLGR